jgi:peptide/nickel transport system ATP-binding protein
VSAPALEIRDLAVRFPTPSGEALAVDGLALSVAPGEIVALVGESGSGKSVTAMSVLGLVPPPGRVSGSIRVAGTQVVGAGESTLRRLRGRGAAMIFQNPVTALNPYFTIGRQLGDVIRLHHGGTREAVRTQVIDALTRVRLPDPATQYEKYPHQLSGGQLQRVVLAMALACRPQLLIADEPTTALDVTVQAQILELMRDLAVDSGTGLLFITHDLGAVGALCHRVAVLYLGRLVESGRVEDVFASPAHPYTAGLLATVPRMGAGIGGLRAIPGQVPDLSALPAGCPFHPRCERATLQCAERFPETTGAARQVACHHPIEPPSSGMVATTRACLS